MSTADNDEVYAITTEEFWLIDLDKVTIQKVTGYQKTSLTTACRFWTVDGHGLFAVDINLFKDKQAAKEHMGMALNNRLYAAEQRIIKFNELD